MPKRTNPFQHLIALIMAVYHEPQYIVEESVLEQNPRTGYIREIDIKITNTQNSNDKTMIECRAHRRRQGVEWLDAIDGKARSIGYSKIIAISKSGFVEKAEIEAADRGIEILCLQEVEERDFSKWLFSIKQMGLHISGPIHKSVDFGVDADWEGEIPEINDIHEVTLVDTKNELKIPLVKWIDDLLNDPTQQKYMFAIKEEKPNQELIHTTKCSQTMGMMINGCDTFIPLAELTIHADFIQYIDEIQLRHIM